MTDMVKNKDYSHPEVGVLREADLQRMKVRMFVSQEAIRRPSKE